MTTSRPDSGSVFAVEAHPFAQFLVGDANFDAAVLLE